MSYFENNQYTASKVSSCSLFFSSILEIGIFEVNLFVIGFDSRPHQRCVVSWCVLLVGEKHSSGYPKTGTPEWRVSIS